MADLSEQATNSAQPQRRQQPAPGKTPSPATEAVLDPPRAPSLLSITTSSRSASQAAAGPAEAHGKLAKEVSCLQARLQQQEERFTQQEEYYERELARLRESVAHLLARVATPALPKTPELSQPARRAASRTTAALRRGRKATRRGLLQTLGAGAAALVATGLLSGQEALSGRTGRAEATQGQPVIAGGYNSATAPTTIDNTITGSTGDGLDVYANNGVGVYGNSSSATGVYGYSSSSYGVYGYSNNSSGVYGRSSSSYAVVGYSSSSYGVYGVSSSSVDLYAAGTGRLLLNPQSSAGAPTSGTHSQGEQVVDSAGNLYLCSAGNNTSVGTWQAVGNFRAFPAPARVYANTAVAPGTTTANISVLGSGVPAGARSAYCAVQAVPSGTGPLTLFPGDGAADPGIANWTAIVPNVLNLFYMLVPLSSAGNFKIHSYISGQIYVDVWGYLL